MKIFGTLEQGTPEWLHARAGVLTASVVGKLIAPKTLKVSGSETAKTVMRTLVSERISGRVESVHPTWQMQRGTLDEPIARGEYVAHTGSPVVEVGFITKEFNGCTLGYSPDGLVGDDGLIEIKSRSNQRHLETVLNDAPPLENMAQLQTGLLVIGRAWIDYVSFSAGMPLYIKRVWPDARWQQAILEAAEMFEGFAAAVETDFKKRVQGLPVMGVPDHYLNDLEPEITL